MNIPTLQVDFSWFSPRSCNSHQQLYLDSVVSPLLNFGTWAGYQSFALLRTKSLFVHRKHYHCSPKANDVTHNCSYRTGWRDKVFTKSLFKRHFCSRLPRCCKLPVFWTVAGAWTKITSRLLRSWIGQLSFLLVPNIALAKTNEIYTFQPLVSFCIYQINFHNIEYPWLFTVFG